MKLLKIAINIIIFICIFVFLDFLYSLYCYERLNNNSKKEYQNANKEKIEFYNSYIKPKYRYFKGVYNFKKLLKYNYETMKDTVEGNDKTKGSIIVFGGSFAYGAFLNQKDTLSYKLSKKTGRTVYNQAIPAMGFGQMLYQTETQDFYNIIKETPDYAMYVYIPDHLFRSCYYKYGIEHEYSDCYYLSYVLKNGRLEEKTPFINYLNRFKIFYDISKNILCSPKHFGTNDDENFDFVKAHFVQARENLQKVYPNIKFVIIKYPFNDNNPAYYDKHSSEYANMTTFYSNRWKELEDMGFIIFDVKKYTGIDVNDSQYQLPDKHPNGNAWEAITPKIIQTLKL